jgi:hypothetical protein
MLTDLQSSSWQEKLYSSFCVIKCLILVMLGVEAALAFFIILRLRIAWAVMLNRFGGDIPGGESQSAVPHAHSARVSEAQLAGHECPWPEAAG